MISSKACISVGTLYVEREILVTVMGHLFESLDTALERHPPALDCVGAPQVPVLVDEVVPIDFRVIVNILGRDSDTKK